MPSRTHKAARHAAFVPIALVSLAVVALAGAALLILRPALAPASAALPTVGRSPGSVAPAATVTVVRSPQHMAVTARDGAVRLAASEFDDGVARFYTYQGAGKAIPFFVLKGSDGVLRAAFDACDVCYTFKKGYHQEGDVMVCNNCGNRFPSVRINVETGGCNPLPLKMQVQGDTIVIQAAALEAGGRYF